MEKVKKKNKFFRSVKTIFIIQEFLFFLFFGLSQNNFAQDKNTGLMYKDDTYKFQFSYPANYVFRKVNNENIQFREKKDFETNTRISVTIVNFETTTVNGKMYDFAQFARAHAKKIYLQKNTDISDSLMIKEYSSNKSIKGKEVFVRLVYNVQQNSTGKEEQVIKGPVFIFDISSKTGIPGTALVIYQVTDDSKSAKVLRAFAEDLGF